MTGVRTAPGRTYGLVTSPETVARYVELLAAVADAGGPPCQIDPDRWHRGEEDPETAEALALCEVCPVLDACRSYALAAREPLGTWGGMTASERRARRRLEVSA